jgi:hypothetical protein
MKLKISFKRNPISTLWSTKLTIFQNFPNKLTQSSFVSLKKENKKKVKHFYQSCGDVFIPFVIGHASHILLEGQRMELFSIYN